MAYLAKIEPQYAEPIARTAVPANDTDKPEFNAPLLLSPLPPFD